MAGQSSLKWAVILPSRPGGGRLCAASGGLNAAVSDGAAVIRLPLLGWMVFGVAAGVKDGVAVVAIGHIQSAR